MSEKDEEGSSPYKVCFGRVHVITMFYPAPDTEIRTSVLETGDESISNDYTTDREREWGPQKAINFPGMIQLRSPFSTLS